MACSLWEFQNMPNCGSIAATAWAREWFHWRNVSQCFQKWPEQETNEFSLWISNQWFLLRSCCWSCQKEERVVSLQAMPGYKHVGLLYNQQVQMKRWLSHQLDGQQCDHCCQKCLVTFDETTKEATKVTKPKKFSQFWWTSSTLSCTKTTQWSAMSSVVATTDKVHLSLQFEGPNCRTF